MTKISVLYDACVLYPAPLRDLLMHLAISDIYKAKWTNEIHDEWIRNVLLNRKDLVKSQLERTRSLMNRHVQDCLVDNYQHLIETIKLPDPDDRHVVAAAVHSSSSIILTYNLKDFPPKSIQRYGIQAQHPDKFIAQLIELDAFLVCSTIKRLRESLKNPPITAQNYLEILKKQSLPQTVKKLERLLTLI